METPAMTIPGIEDQAATSAAPQATQVPDQSGPEPQDTPSSQVETGDSHAASQEDPRKASEFETARQIKRLTKQMQSLHQAFEKGQQQIAVPGIPQTQSLPQVTNEDILKDPAGAFNRILDARLAVLKGEIPQNIQQLLEVQRHEKSRQEAVRLIKTNSSVKADPEGHDRIADILTEEDEFGNSLEKYALQNPQHAAYLALMEYQNRFENRSRRSSSAPTKAQMQTTATAVNSGVPKSTLEQESAVLYRQVLADPALMSDPEFRKKLDAFDKKNRMETLLAQNK